MVATQDEQKLFAMSHNPTVSIGLPVHNGARYLREAIGDFLHQTYEDFELIVSDNASTDETEAIVREAAALHERIRYVRNETNIGALPNSNRTIELARGRYFCLAAHDDRHAPDFLERLVAALEENSDAVLAYSRCVLIDEAGEPLRAIPERGLHTMPNGQTVDYDQKLERPLPSETVKRYHVILQSNDVNAPTHGLFRRRSLERIGGPHFHGSDRLIVAHAALLGRFVFVDEPLFSFRIHSGSTLFLSREEWAKRETGEELGASPLATLGTLRNFWKAVGQTDLDAGEKIGAYSATVAFAFRPAAIRRALLPSPDNYFGWKRWPWQRDPKARFAAPSRPATSTTGTHA